MRRSHKFFRSPNRPAPPTSASLPPGALRALEATGQDPSWFLSRHLSGDWGEVDAEDKAANDQGLIAGDRLLSAYRLADTTRIWIITEWYRSATTTTILLPEEY